MRIAFSSDTDQGTDSPISGHFGRCPFYVLVDLEKNRIARVQAISNPFLHEHQPGDIPDFISQQGAHVIISGGMGRRAYGFFQQHGIKVATGAQGSVGSALNDYLHGALFEGEPNCGGGGHHHGGGGCHSSHD